MGALAVLGVFVSAGHPVAADPDVAPPIAAPPNVAPEPRADGSAAVLVPAGRFRQGGAQAPDEAPAHEVTLSAYTIDTTEVDTGQFEVFVASGALRERRWWSEEGWEWAQAHPDGAGTRLRASGRPADHPVVGVTWFEADAYCRWRGGALPTEAQWERAACGDEPRRYPWGDTEDFEATWYKEGKFGHLAGVGTAPAGVQDPALRSPYGLLHAAGNVWEWTADSYDAGYYADAPALDPVDTRARPWRTLRGGSYANLPSYCTCTHREPAAPDDVRLTVGFRCASSP